MKTIIITLMSLFPFLVYGQQADSTNFHLLSEFAVDKNEKTILTKKKKYYRPIQEKGDTLSRYEITKIDSVGQYYIIDAKNSKYVYRIVSKKNFEFQCKSPIKVGGIYQLDLRSLLDVRGSNNDNLRIHIATNKVGFPPAMVPRREIDENDIEYSDKFGEWRVHLGLYNRAKNLSGLCLVDKNDKSSVDTYITIDKSEYYTNIKQTDSTNFHLLSEFNIYKNKRRARKHRPKKDTLSLYEITKIDSIGEYYLIEAKNNRYIYRIASPKRNDKHSNCADPIKVGGIYQLDLRNSKQRIHIDPNRDESSPKSISINDILYYDKNGDWRIKLGLHNQASNLHSLCVRWWQPYDNY